MKLTFVTSNDGKYRSFRNIVEKELPGTELGRHAMDYPENKEENDTEPIAREGAVFCAEELGRPVVVTDGGLFIDALDGFPGVNTGFALKTVGNQGILDLLERYDDRAARFEITLGYAAPGEEPETFKASVEGNITEKQRGSEGFGFDPIFSPERHEETYAENPDIRDSEGPLKEAFEKFVASRRD